MLTNFYKDKMEADAADEHCAELIRDHVSRFGWVPNERLFRCSCHEEFVAALEAALNHNVPLDQVLQRSNIYKGSWFIQHTRIPASLH